MRSRAPRKSKLTPHQLAVVCALLENPPPIPGRVRWRLFELDSLLGVSARAAFQAHWFGTLPPIPPELATCEARSRIWEVAEAVRPNIRELSHKELEVARTALGLARPPPPPEFDALGWSGNPERVLPARWFPEDFLREELMCCTMAEAGLDDFY